jgi:hypothetical protein
MIAGGRLKKQCGIAPLAIDNRHSRIGNPIIAD